MYWHLFYDFYDIFVVYFTRSSNCNTLLCENVISTEKIIVKECVLKQSKKDYKPNKKKKIIRFNRINIISVQKY